MPYVELSPISLLHYKPSLQWSPYLWPWPPRIKSALPSSTSVMNSLSRQMLWHKNDVMLLTRTCQGYKCPRAHLGGSSPSENSLWETVTDAWSFCHKHAHHGGVYDRKQSETIRMSKKTLSWLNKLWYIHSMNTTYPRKLLLNSENVYYKTECMLRFYWLRYLFPQRMEQKFIY